MSRKEIIERIKEGMDAFANGEPTPDDRLAAIGWRLFQNLVETVATVTNLNDPDYIPQEEE